MADTAAQPAYGSQAGLGAAAESSAVAEQESPSAEEIPEAEPEPEREPVLEPEPAAVAAAPDGEDVDAVLRELQLENGRLLAEAAPAAATNPHHSLTIGDSAGGGADETSSTAVLLRQLEEENVALRLEQVCTRTPHHSMIPGLSLTTALWLEQEAQELHSGESDQAVLVASLLAVMAKLQESEHPQPVAAGPAKTATGSKRSGSAGSSVRKPVEPDGR